MEETKRIRQRAKGSCQCPSSIWFYLAIITITLRSQTSRPIQSHLTKPSQRWSIIKALRLPVSTCGVSLHRNHSEDLASKDMATTATRQSEMTLCALLVLFLPHFQCPEHPTACKAFRMRGQAALRGRPRDRSFNGFYSNPDVSLFYITSSVLHGGLGSCFFDTQIAWAVRIRILWGI